MEYVKMSPLVLMPMLFSGVSAAGNFTCPSVTFNTTGDIVLPHYIEKYEAVLLLLLGFGSLSIFLALLYILIRRYVFEDTNNVDATFDAGGNVSTSLTAVTIAAQLLWPGDLMQSVTVAVKWGIAGCFWYCGGAIINLALFPLLSFKFKTRAPGAKTFLQIFGARFGRPAHLVFIFFALMVNVVIMTTILVGGVAVMQSTIDDISDEFCILILVSLCGSYSFIGGLGSTFYVSYFNALTTFVVLSVMVGHMFYLKDLPFGDFEEIYNKVNCLPPVDGNKDGSYFTFLSEGSALFGVSSVFLVTSITYCDQASWQSRIAARPLQGALGFLLGGFIWFSVPATIGTAAGVTYLAVSATDPDSVLSEAQINSGIVSTFMSQKALGKQGAIMMLTMLTMLTMSTGSGEIMGVSSIFVYDVYQKYINPFRTKMSSVMCVFCGQDKAQTEHSEIKYGDAKPLPESSICTCPAVLSCVDCKADLEALRSVGGKPGKVTVYTCPYHASYRAYQDKLVSVKNWTVLCVTLGLVPFGMVMSASGVDLNWAMTYGTTLLVPAFPPVILSILWVKTTGKAVTAGSISGLVCGLIANTVVSYGYYEGEGGFLVVTTQPYSLISGSGTACMMSLLVTVVTSLATHNIRSPDDEHKEWAKLRDIDNPLHPWTLQFEDYFPEVKDGTYRPTYTQLSLVTRKGKTASVIGACVFFVIFIIVIPGSMASLDILNAMEFGHWTTLINVWCLCMAVVIILVTPVEEIRSIMKEIWAKRRRRAIQDTQLSPQAAHNKNTPGIPLKEGRSNTNFVNNEVGDHQETTGTF